MVYELFIAATRCLISYYCVLTWAEGFFAFAFFFPGAKKATGAIRKKMFGKKKTKEKKRRAVPVNAAVLLTGRARVLPSRSTRPTIIEI